MSRSHIILSILVISIALSGCAKRFHIDDAKKAGSPQLSGKQIQDLITESTIHLTSWDKADEANVTFFADGSLEGENRWGETTTGRWKIDKKDQLCLKYRKWGSGFLTCYSIFQMDDSYKLFRVDGGLDTSFTVVSPGSKSTVQPIVVSAPSSSTEATVVPEKEKKSWLSGLWPWGGKEDSTPPALKSDNDVFIAPTPDVEKSLSADLLKMLDDGECPGCDLSGKDMAEIKLKGAELKEANLSGAVLVGTNLKNANLKGANLSGANLEGANLENANLEGADLSRARLVDTILEDARLESANLESANLHWADLRDANLGNANLTKAYLVKTNFTDADLTGANLNEAVIQRTIFEDTKGYTPPVAEEREEVKNVLEPVKKDKKWWWPF